MDSKYVESGVQLFSRVNQKPSLSGINPKLFAEGEPSANQVIELVFENQAEKSDLMMDFIVRCILPTEYNHCWKGCGAILFNTTFQISLMNIIKVMNVHLKNLNVPNRKSVIETSLKNLTIFNCYDSEQTKLTFYNLEKVLQQKENVALVLVDSITSHYWLEKMTKQMLSMHQHAKNVFEMLYSVVKSLNLTLCYSRYDRDVTKMSVSANVDYKIIVQKINKQDYTAVILDYNKQVENRVNFCTSEIIMF